MSPVEGTAASFVPSEEEVMDIQLLAPGVEPWSVQVQLEPEYVAVQISPNATTAASFVPSEEEARHSQCLEPAAVWSVHAKLVFTVTT